jgi:hypothetical protein
MKAILPAWINVDAWGSECRTATGTERVDITLPKKIKDVNWLNSPNLLLMHWSPIPGLGEN